MLKAENSLYENPTFAFFKILNYLELGADLVISSLNLAIAPFLSPSSTKSLP